MTLLEPVLRPEFLASHIDQLIEVLAKRDIRQPSIETFKRYGLQNHLGVTGDLPKIGIQLTPDVFACVIPLPAQIQRQLRQGFEAGNIPRQRS
jgi:hypothetical protein